jgi:hypothetical protein
LPDYREDAAVGQFLSDGVFVWGMEVSVPRIYDETGRGYDTFTGAEGS